MKKSHSNWQMIWFTVSSLKLQFLYLHLYLHYSYTCQSPSDVDSHAPHASFLALREGEGGCGGGGGRGVGVTAELCTSAITFCPNCVGTQQQSGNSRIMQKCTFICSHLQTLQTLQTKSKTLYRNGFSIGGESLLADRTCNWGLESFL